MTKAELAITRREKRIADLIDSIRRLEQHSYAQSPNGANGKDLAAFQALSLAGMLVQELAGWAINHQIGLGLEDLRFMPPTQLNTKNLPEYQERLREVDDHLHETKGEHWLIETDQNTDPVTARHILRNLLFTNPGGFPRYLTARIAEQLDDLDAGEQGKIFTAEKTTAKATPAEQRCQLEALAHVAFHKARNIPKVVTYEKVGKALGVHASTVRHWEYELRNDEAIGHLKVSRILNAATHVGLQPPLSLQDPRFSDRALTELGLRYKKEKIRRTKKAPDNDHS